MLVYQRVNSDCFPRVTARYEARHCTGAPLGHVAKGGQDQLHTDVGHDEGHAVPRVMGCQTGWMFHMFI
jgi:hypothetical protein